MLGSVRFACTDERSRSDEKRTKRSTRVSKGFALFLAALVILLVCLYLGLFLGVRSNAGRKRQTPRPNIVVIIADDLGWNDVSFHGADQIPTPNIDALAYNGVTLQRHYVLPTCTPSRSAFLTGRYAIRTGMQGYPLRAGEPRAIPLNETLLPEYLRDLGYRTHLVGKWHVGYPTNRHTPAYRGFDTFYGYYSGYIQYFNHTIGENGHEGYDLHNDVRGNLTVEYNYEYMTDLIADRAEDLIKRHDQQKPLYLQIAHLAAHCSDADDPMEVRDKEEMDRNLGYIKDVNRRKLAGMVTALDESVGRVVRALNEAGMLANSIIVFMSDNGAQSQGFLENFGSNYPLRGQKMTLWEGGIRGVACVYSPLIKRPARITDELFHITDWLPTLYSAAGGDTTDLKVDGVDQWQTLITGRRTVREAIMLNIDEAENVSAALIGRHKLIQGTPKYMDYYGDPGNSDTYPKYNVTSVLRSPAGFAIAKLSVHVLKEERLLRLRNRSRVVCDRISDYPRCTSSCLFDVRADPCETKDLSEDYPEIVEQLSDYIGRYRAVMMPQTNAPVDPASYPEKHNGVWMPWIEDDRLL